MVCDRCVWLWASFRSVFTQKCGEHFAEVNVALIKALEKALKRGNDISVLDLRRTNVTNGQVRFLRVCCVVYQRTV